MSPATSFSLRARGSLNEKYFLIWQEGCGGITDLPQSWGPLVVNKATVTCDIGRDGHRLTLPDWETSPGLVSRSSCTNVFFLPCQF